MLKRTTNFTSLLLVAASIVSMVPAMAADLKTNDVQEGTIYDGHAVGGGKYIIKGYINDEDDTAFYFLSDGKYTKLDDADTNDTYSDLRENKYAEFQDDHGDYYYVDVTNGKVTDEYSQEQIIDTMEKKLRKNIKNDNDGRFNASNYANNTVPASNRGYGNVFIAGATGKWARFEYELSDKDKAKTLNGKTTDTIYSNLNGDYVDADYNLGKVQAFVTTGSSVTFRNTKDVYSLGNYAYRAQIKNINTFDEEPDGMYRKASLTIWRKDKNQDDSSYENITDKVSFGGSNNNYTQKIDDSGVTVMQKIGLTPASDTVDGIKYAKDVMTCFITDEDGNEAHVLGFGDVSDLGTSVDWGGGDVALVTGSIDGLASHFFDASEKKYYAQNFNLKSQKGYYYVDLGDTDDTDADSWTIGGGNLYCIGERYVKKWSCKDSKFEKIYKVDGGLSSISAAFGDSVIVWDKNNKIYSTLNKEILSDGQKDTATTTGGAVIVQTISAGWTKDSDGNWSYNNTDGTKKIGWFNDNGTWYYLKPDGIMSTGWVQAGGSWYYCDESGKMLSNTMADGYELGANGAWVKR